MKWTIDNGSMPYYIRVETDGDASSESIVAMWDELIQSDSWSPGLTVLIDNRKLKQLKDGEAITNACIDYFAENKDRIGKACISTVSDHPENFKFARQFQYGTRLKGSDVVLQLFTSESQALRWLDHYSKLQPDEFHTVSA